MGSAFPRCVLVTGATGNLGSKVVEALAHNSGCERIVGIDRAGDLSRFSDTARAKLQLVHADLTQPLAAWEHAFEGVEATVHFAAVSALPDSTWLEAIASYEMTMNVAMASARAGAKRFVFASSNHAMGAYKDLPLSAKIGPGLLTNDIPTAPGTRWHDGTREIHSLAYGTSKVLGEQFCAAAAALTEGRLTTVAVRVGWALTGDNHPRDITHSGSPASTSDVASLDDDAQRALRWFRNMWLSNGDLAQLFNAAVSADSAHWPAPSVIVNGVSNNRDMDWSLSTARQYLSYAPQDDVYAYLAAQ